MLGLELEHFRYITPVLFVITYLSAFEKGKPTCKRYLVNALLYLLTSLSLYIATLSFPAVEIPEFIDVIGIIILVGLLVLVENVLLKHIILIVLIILLGMMVKSFYDKYEEDDIDYAALQTFIFLLIGTGIAYIKPNLFTGKGYKYLFLFYSLAFLSMILDYFINGRHRKLWSYIFVIIFFLFIMFDMKTIFVHSKTCSPKNPPDYISVSFDVFIDLVNIMNNLLRING